MHVIYISFGNIFSSNSILFCAAFLLDGSSDLALAAAAEEAAREACRLGAKNIFRDRKTTASDSR